MKRTMTAVALMALGAGCASTAHAEGKKSKEIEHQVIVTSDDEGSKSKTVEVRIEDGNVVKFLVNGKEVDPDEVDWTDGYVTFGGEGGENTFFIASPDEDFEFEFDNEFAFAFGDEDNNVFFAPHATSQRAVLGVRVEDSEDGGIRIVELTDGGAAKESGIKAGDVIVKLDGEDAGDVSTLLRRLGTKEPGDTMKVLVTRDGDNKSFKVKLKGDPQAPGSHAFVIDPHEGAQWHNDKGFAWRVAPRIEVDEHKRILLERHHGKLRERLGEHHERLKGLHDKHLIELKGLHEKQLLHLEELEGLHELKELEGLKVLETLKGELHELKALEGEAGQAFAFAFGGEGSCECDCECCGEGCKSGGGHAVTRWAPRADEIKRRMHVELRERAEKLRDHKAFSDKQRVEIEKHMEKARRALENIEIDIDMPEIEVIIEALEDEDGNVVFVPDAPKMRQHWVTRHKGDANVEKDVVVEVAPKGHVKKRVAKDSASDKLERESRLARFEERLERLEKLIKRLMHESDKE
ncbi:MAG: PDZ domain-containing protein [Phycisphaerales bacterium JB043]